MGDFMVYYQAELDFDKITFLEAPVAPPMAELAGLQEVP